MSTVEVEFDEALLARIDELAATQGKPRAEVIADAVRSQLGGGRLREILASVRARSELSEREAMEIAISELDAYRDEQARGASA